MIGQYLPNNNEKSYSAVLQNFFESKPALSTLLPGILPAAFPEKSRILSFCRSADPCLPVILGQFRIQTTIAMAPWKCPFAIPEEACCFLFFLFYP
jgi:hypothetical protein